MKRTSLILAAVVALAIAGVAFRWWDAAKNRGYTWGYWGQFNTVNHALAEVPGITIVKSYCNTDITLEEFGFDIATSDGRRFHLGFEEKDPTRHLSGVHLERALAKIVREQTSSHAASARNESDLALRSLLQRGEPVHWDASSRLTLDVDDDGRADYAFLGRIGEKRSEKGFAVAVVYAPLGEMARVNVLRYHIDGVSQDGLSAYPVMFETEALDYDATDAIAGLPGFRRSQTAEGLLLDDHLSDPIHIYWDHKHRQLAWWRL